MSEEKSIKEIAMERERKIINSRSMIYHSTGDVFLDLRKMHNHYGFDNYEFTHNQLQGRLDFLKEEIEETQEAFDENNAEEIVDGLIDLIVVAVGTLDRLEVDSWKAWAEVRKANMSKKVGVNKKRPNSEGIDLVKPEDWQPPSHKDNLGILPKLLDEEKKIVDSGDTTVQITFERKQHLLNEEEQLEKAKDEYKKFASKLNFNTNEVIVEEDINQNLRFRVLGKREAIHVFKECIDLMEKKSQDYNSNGSAHSSIKAVDYYPLGLDSLYQMLYTKLIRIRSVMDNIKANQNQNFESIEDSLKDLMVYAAFTVEFCRRKMEGQDENKDLFNREVKKQ